MSLYTYASGGITRIDRNLRESMDFCEGPLNLIPTRKSDPRSMKFVPSPRLPPVDRGPGAPWEKVLGAARRGIVALAGHFLFEDLIRCLTTRQPSESWTRGIGKCSYRKCMRELRMHQHSFSF
jgi:hypothetical protein